MRKIDKVVVEAIEFPLIEPYILSFNTIRSFESFRVTIILDDGQSAAGEVVPLFGYSHESAAAIGKYLQEIPNRIEKGTLQDARELLEKEIRTRPFSVSPVLTAIDLLENPMELPLDLNVFEYVVPSSTKKIEQLLTRYKKTCLQEDGVLKIKLSGDPDIDIAAFEQLRTQLDGNRQDLRLDANQAYNKEEGLRFFEFLHTFSGKDHIQYVEQPYPVEKWDWNGETSERFPTIPIMIDEAIMDESDIDRAIAQGIRIIKLKLYKQGGIKELLNCAKYAHEKQVDVVLGNGVAGHLTNQIEVAVYQMYPERFRSVLEANGFKKLR